MDRCAGGESSQRGERGLSLAQAWQRGRDAIAELGLTTTFQVADGAADFTCWTCTLTDRVGQPASRGFGSGKGRREEARVGALFEAVEHLMSGTRGFGATGAVLRRAHDVAVGDLTVDVAVRLLRDGPDEPLACRPAESLVDGTRIALPLFLSCPDYLADARREQRAELGDHYDYTGVGRYSINSGCASGANRDEALVHALNEIVERDAFSLLLSRQFLAGSGAPDRLAVLDPDSLPPDLAELRAVARHRAGGEVHLVEMTTDLAVPAVLAYLVPTRGVPARVRGCGASLSRHHATWRALTELCQLASGSSAEAGLQEPASELAKYPPLHACYRADLTTALREADTVTYRDTTAPQQPAEHLRQLISRIAASGHTPYFSTLHTFRNDVTVVSAFVPGLERFLLITDGNLVIPGPRALEARNSPRSAGTRIPVR